MGDTIHDYAVSASYVATAGQTVFALPCKLFEGYEDDFVVEVDNVVQLYDPTPGAGEFKTTATGDEGLNITLGTACTAGQVVRCWRALPIERLTSFPETGPVSMEEVNNELTRIVALVQDVYGNEAYRIVEALIGRFIAGENVAITFDEGDRSWTWDIDLSGIVDDLEAQVQAAIDAAAAAAASAASAAAAAASAASAASDASTAQAAAEAALATMLAILDGLGDGGNMGSRVLSGLGVSWESGLTFRVSAGSFFLNNTFYTATEQTITLDASDPTNPRIDVIAINASSTVIKITGTPAASPAKPDVDELEQLELTFVNVAAGATEPGEDPVDPNEIVYDENDDWTGTTSGAVNLNATDFPHAGAKNIRFTAASRGNYAQFQRASAVQASDYLNLTLFIRPIDTNWGTSALRLTIGDGSGRQIGRTVALSNGTYGLNTASATYQQVTVPLSAFAIPAGTAMQRIRVGVSGSGASLDVAIDDIQLTPVGSTGNGGGGSGGTSGLTQAQADARYMPLLAVRETGLTSYTLAAVDANAERRFTAASAVECIVPLEATVPFAVGTRIRLAQDGAGRVTLTPEGAVVLKSADSALISRTRYSVFEVVRLPAADTWEVLGDVSAT